MVLPRQHASLRRNMSQSMTCYTLSWEFPSISKRDNAVKYCVVSEKYGHGVMALIVIGNTIKICLQE